MCSLEQAELDLAGEKERLQVCLGACQQEVGACRQELEQVRSEHSRQLEKLQAGHREEKAQLQQEVEAEQRSQRSMQEELATLQTESKKVCLLLLLAPLTAALRAPSSCPVSTG